MRHIDVVWHITWRLSALSHRHWLLDIQSRKIDDDDADDDDDVAVDGGGDGGDGGTDKTTATSSFTSTRVLCKYQRLAFQY